MNVWPGEWTSRRREVWMNGRRNVRINKKQNKTKRVEVLMPLFWVGWKSWTEGWGFGVAVWMRGEMDGKGKVF